MHALVRARLARRAVREFEVRIARDPPYLAKIVRRAERGRHARGDGHPGSLDVRGLGESDDTENVAPPQCGARRDLVHRQIVELERGHMPESILPPPWPVGGGPGFQPRPPALNMRRRGRCLPRLYTRRWRSRRAGRSRTASPNRSCSGIGLVPARPGYTKYVALICSALPTSKSTVLVPLASWISPLKLSVLVGQ